MNKGATKCCPYCKKILVRHINPYTKGDLEVTCRHCGRDFKIVADQVLKIELIELDTKKPK